MCHAAILYQQETIKGRRAIYLVAQEIILMVDDFIYGAKTQNLFNRVSYSLKSLWSNSTITINMFLSHFIPFSSPNKQQHTWFDCLTTVLCESIHEKTTVEKWQLNVK